jgi:hypothetical protein
MAKCAIDEAKADHRVRVFFPIIELTSKDFSLI